MSQVIESNIETRQPVTVAHVIRGEVQLAADVEHRFRGSAAIVRTPRISLDQLVWSRAEPGPAFEVPIGEIIDFLAEAGRRLDLTSNRFLAEAIEQSAPYSPLGRRVMENCYRDIPNFFRREGILLEIERSLGGPGVLDGWKSAPGTGGEPARIRAYPPRLVHVLAGNAPAVQALTIVRAAITKGVHLLKLPSNDFFTATAILRTFVDMDPNHPVTKSFSAVYWRGGDERIESPIFRSQYFDKIVVWGGEAAVRHASKYVGPGFEMVSFDPKVSISLIGREIFESESALEDAARLAGRDVGDYDQDACNSSRFQFVEGTTEQVDRYCLKLLHELGRDTPFGNGKGAVVPKYLRDEIDALRSLDSIYGVFGNYDGRGVVIRSDEPVGFTPTGKAVNVVQVASLESAVRHVTVATQTVGIWPSCRRKALRDGLSSAGAQRITTLGTASGVGGGFGGLPHDASWPLNRFMRWILDSGAQD